TLEAALRIVWAELANLKPVDFNGPNPDTREHNRVLGDAAHLQALFGNLPDALATVRRINHGDQELDTLKRLACDRAYLGDLDGAMKVIAEIHGPKGEAEALEGVAMAVATQLPPGIH